MQQQRIELQLELAPIRFADDRFLAAPARELQWLTPSTVACVMRNLMYWRLHHDPDGRVCCVEPEGGQNLAVGQTIAVGGVSAVIEAMDVVPCDQQQQDPSMRSCDACTDLDVRLLVTRCGSSRVAASSS